MNSFTLWILSNLVSSLTTSALLTSLSLGNISWVDENDWQYWCLTFFRSQVFITRTAEASEPLSPSFPPISWRAFQSSNDPGIWKWLHFAFLNHWIHNQLNQLILLKVWEARVYEQFIFYGYCSLLIIASMDIRKMARFSKFHLNPNTRKHSLKIQMKFNLHGVFELGF